MNMQPKSMSMTIIQLKGFSRHSFQRDSGTLLVIVIDKLAVDFEDGCGQAIIGIVDRFIAEPGFVAAECPSGEAEWAFLLVFYAFASYDDCEDCQDGTYDERNGEDCGNVVPEEFFHDPVIQL